MLSSRAALLSSIAPIRAVGFAGSASKVTRRCLASVSSIPSEPTTRPLNPVAYVPVHNGSEERYWTQVPRWKDVTVNEFVSHKWQMANTVQNAKSLFAFLDSVLPSDIPVHRPMNGPKEYEDIITKADFVRHVELGMQRAPMAVRLSPHVLSVIDWSDPLNDPVRRQFIPLLTSINVDHPAAKLDPLQEGDNSPVPGFIQRYPTKALFMTTTICPVYCRFCFRSYSVGAETDTVKKQKFLPILKQWIPRFEHIERTPSIRDIVLSGGDTYILEPSQIQYLGERLLDIPHVKRFRFASKGLSVSPSRLIDPDDDWVNAVIRLSQRARKMGKHVCIHTHFNSRREISWITRLGTQRLYEAGVTVRNQSVMLNGVNNSVEEMLGLVNELTEMNIDPYYVYQGDMTLGAEDLRTPLHQLLALEHALSGQMAGFLVPRFIVDVPGGGKTPLLRYRDYDRHLGTAFYPAHGLEEKEYQHWDPLWSLSPAARDEVTELFARRRAEAASSGRTKTAAAFVKPLPDELLRAERERNMHVAYH